MDHVEVATGTEEVVETDTEEAVIPEDQEDAGAGERGVAATAESTRKFIVS